MKMTKAMIVTISCLCTLETSNTNSIKKIDTMVGHLNHQGYTLEAQGKEIKALGSAFTTQNVLILALQTTQVQQG